METKTCQNCKENFVIAPEDFVFYDKMAVPPPTFCPICRLQRRMAWRNEFSFFKRDCSLCKKSIIAIYPSSVTFPVYCNECWWGDTWDPYQYGKEYDPSRPFLAQVKELISKAPRIAAFRKNCINCDYTNYSYDGKDGYLATGYIDSENCMYGTYFWHDKDSFDSFYLLNSELCYQALNSEKCYRSAFIEDSTNCSESWFLYNCRNLQNCIGCTNLENKEYYIWNEPHTKEEYLAFVKQYFPLNQSKLSELREKFNIIVRSTRKQADITSSENSTGNHIRNSKNAKDSFYVSNAEDSRFVFVSEGARDCYDITNAPKTESLYEYVSMVGGARCKFSSMCTNGLELEYCDLCPSAQNCFGCIGLKNGQYSILNIRYSKEEYMRLKKEIIDQMNKTPYIDGAGLTYTYGEFFPIELSPFAYNESQANDYFPLNKERIFRLGYAYRDSNDTTHAITLKSENLPEYANESADEISREVIECIDCKRGYRIVSNELIFYKTLGLPLPHKCPACRRKDRKKLITLDVFKT